MRSISEAGTPVCDRVSLVQFESWSNLIVTVEKCPTGHIFILHLITIAWLGIWSQTAHHDYGYNDGEIGRGRQTERWGEGGRLGDGEREVDGETVAGGEGGRVRGSLWLGGWHNDTWAVVSEIQIELHLSAHTINHRYNYFPIIADRNRLPSITDAQPYYQERTTTILHTAASLLYEKLW